jgi:hypothetical protein
MLLQVNDFFEFPCITALACSFNAVTCPDIRECTVENFGVLYTKKKSSVTTVVSPAIELNSRAASLTRSFNTEVTEVLLAHVRGTAEKPSVPCTQ